MSQVCVSSLQAGGGAGGGDAGEGGVGTGWDDGLGSKTRGKSGGKDGIGASAAGGAGIGASAAGGDRVGDGDGGAGGDMVDGAGIGDGGGDFTGGGGLATVEKPSTSTTCAASAKARHRALRNACKVSDWQGCARCTARLIGKVARAVRASSRSSQCPSEGGMHAGK